MNVSVLYRNDPDRPLTAPLPDTDRLIVRVYRGDYCDPFFGNWFARPWPRVIVRLTLRWMPFIAWRLGRWRGYVGFKVWGVDSPSYRNWLPAGDVYSGSLACCFSVRPVSFSGGSMNVSADRAL